MNSQNAEAMARAIRIVRDLAGRTPAERRADLLAHGPDGMSVFDRFVTARERTHEPINAPAFKAVDLLDSLHDRGDEIA
ncbi:MAG: hypothetical protein LBT54_02575 [Bifidobacteriaceae bacterium]|jgi:hypothetical protein|nr:hypothetical protein [Bifidobacteriaceae bacterium]